jgi:hypothetical protein
VGKALLFMSQAAGIAILFTILDHPIVMHPTSYDHVGAFGSMALVIVFCPL